MIKPLIYNSDIKEIEKKAEKQSISSDEADLLRHKGLSESRIQQACRSYFSYQFPNCRFIQIDNGNTFFDIGGTKEERKGNREQFQRKMMINRRRKKAEGTLEGMKDVLLIGKNKIAFIEFKKVGAPSEIEPTDDQKELHKFLIDCGWPAYFCNNASYFRKIICGEFAA